MAVGASANQPVGATATRVSIVTSWRHLPLVLRAATPMSNDDLFDFCSANRELRIERSANGDIIIMPPTGADTGRRNAEITAQLVTWTKKNGAGVAFDSSTGFLLPNGAERSPDASWVRRNRWDALSADDRTKFAPLCPDFVVELRSPSDTLDELTAKMDEYAANGARLGLLVDPLERRVHVYRAQQPAVVLDGPDEVDASPEMPAFVLDLRTVW